MKVLWFEVTEPSAYNSDNKTVNGGWQDSLERIIKTIPDIELFIAFMSEIHSEVKVVDGVTYVPIHAKWNFFEKTFSKYWDVFVQKMLPEAHRILNEYSPDLIHIFGLEWPYGQIAKCTQIPVVIHIMGSIVPYNNAAYPPGYSYEKQIVNNVFHFRRLIKIWSRNRYFKNWEKWERKTWGCVSNYMGRTQWDDSLSRVMHPDRNYFHVDEALRSIFLSEEYRWELPNSSKLKLVSTGLSSFWKGPDMMLKVARILYESNVDFEWTVVGNIDETIKKDVEKTEKCKFNDVNVHIIGFKQPEELIRILSTSTMYIHTAYIENSPNSICEAQCLGVPVISTNVGGISSLVRSGIDGVLVAANDPWQMADAIMQHNKDKRRLQLYSDNSREFALKRHKDDNIRRQLLACYNELLNR